MTHIPFLSVIIPTYNERGNIVSLITSIQKLLKKKSITYEIIVVDDNSPDNTYSQVKNTFIKNKSVRPYVRTNERGLASAIAYGIQKANGEIIVGMDADFNHPPHLIPEMIKRLEYTDIVVASRFIKGGFMGNQIRYICTYVFNLFLKCILSFPVMDNLSGFYAVKRQTLLRLPLTEIYRGYGEYHLRLLAYAQNVGLKIAEIPVTYGKRNYGISKSPLVLLFFRYAAVALQLRMFKK